MCVPFWTPCLSGLLSATDPKEEKVNPKMTKVNCEVSAWTTCTHCKDGVCELEEIDLIISYGRSTDYNELFMCDNRVKVKPE